MKQRLAEIQVRQTDALLAPWRNHQDAHPPSSGWVRLIRQALGMTSPQLARRLSISRQAVLDLEQREAKGAITIDALRRAAAAMECDLVYAVVPRTTLGEMVHTRALEKARRELESVALSMRLESQEVEPVEHARQIADRAEQIARDERRTLWEE